MKYYNIELEKSQEIFEKNFRRFFIMEGYEKLVNQHLGENKNITKEMYKIARTIYRGVKNGRFTLDWALERLATGEVHHD